MTGPSVPVTDLVDAGQVAAGDAVVALALQAPHVVTRRVVDGATIRLTFAAVTVRLGRTTPVRRVRQTPEQRAELDTARDIADAYRSVATDSDARWGDGLILLDRDGAVRAEYTCAGRDADTVVLRDAAGRLFDVRLDVTVTARPEAGT